MFISTRKPKKPYGTGFHESRARKTQYKVPIIRHKLTANRLFVSREGKTNASGCQTSLGKCPSRIDLSGCVLSGAKSLPSGCQARNPIPAPKHVSTIANLYAKDSSVINRTNRPSNKTKKKENTARAIAAASGMPVIFASNPSAQK